MTAFREGLAPQAGRRTMARIALALFLALGCRAQGDERGKITFDKTGVVLETAGGSVPMTVEVARTEAQRERGLMFRKSVAPGEGMLFIFERDQPLSFWMKNTLTPLSIAFIAWDGRILEIRDMTPGSLRPVRSSRSCRYALEVPQGWFAQAGAAPGDRLVIEAGEREGPEGAR